MVLITLGVLCFFGYRMMTEPAEGIIVNSSDAVQAPKQPVVQLEQFDGKNFSFAHPDSYVLRQNRPGDNNNPNSLESYNFVMSGMISKLLTVTVTALPSGKLEDDPSYSMRLLHSETYQAKPQTLQGEKVVVIQDKKDYQLVAFWAHTSGGSKKLLTFAINSISMDTSNTDTEYQKMLDSIRWR